MCDKVTVKSVGTFKFVPDSYKNQKMYNKAVDDYAHTFEFVPN